MQVYIDSPIILNGVCLRWKGYINLEKLDGVGGMKFDEDSARVNIFQIISCFLVIGIVGMHWGCIGDAVGLNWGCSRDALGMHLGCTRDTLGMFGML